MAQFFADEDFSLQVVSELRRLGHDVLTVRDIGKASQRWPDEELFFFAVAQRRTILTKNRRHFFTLHRRHPDHHGIIACTENPDVRAMTRMIQETILSRPQLRGEYIRICQQPRR